jgi:hypothetical protein
MFYGCAFEAVMTATFQPGDGSWLSLQYNIMYFYFVTL